MVRTGLVTLTLSLTLAGCGGRMGAGEAMLDLQLKVPSQVGANSQGLGAARQGLWASSSATDLKSLKYFFRSLQICESLETHGSGFDAPKNCLTLYETDKPTQAFDATDPNADLVAQAQAARGSDVGFVDLISAQSREQLTTHRPLRAEDAHAYNWGVVTWAMPVKVTAELAVAGGGRLYTHDGVTTSQQVVFGGINTVGYAYTTTATTPFASPPAQEAVVMPTNGGTWFRFQNPLVISQADLDSGESWSLDLTFDPENLLKATGVGTGSIAYRDQAGTEIRVPMLDITPVPHRASQHVVRETYLGSLSTQNNYGNPEIFDLRIQLYTIDGDATGSVYGVATTTIPTAQTQGMSDLPRVCFIETAGDGTLTLQDWSHGAFVSGFHRQTTVGGSAAATVSCAPNSGLMFGSCSNGGASTAQVTFALTGRQVL